MADMTKKQKAVHDFIKDLMVTRVTVQRSVKSPTNSISPALTA